MIFSASEITQCPERQARIQLFGGSLAVHCPWSAPSAGLTLARRRISAQELAQVAYSSGTVHPRDSRGELRIPVDSREELDAR